MSIDWEKVAAQNGLKPAEFEEEILMVAACMGAMRLDAHKDTDALKFTCGDDVGPIELIIRRPTNNKGEGIMEQAYKEGQEAYFNEDSINSNPYSNIDPLHNEWHLGFRLAKFNDKQRKQR